MHKEHQPLADLQEPGGVSGARICRRKPGPDEAGKEVRTGEEREQNFTQKPRVNTARF